MVHLSRPLVLELGQSNAEFLVRLMAAVSDRVLLLTEEIDAVLLKTIRQRVIDFPKYEYYRQGKPRFAFIRLKKDLAKRLGIQRTSLSREFNKMRQVGLPNFDAKTIRLIRIIVPPEASR